MKYFPYFDALSVLLVKAADIEGVGSVDLPSRRDQWRRVLLMVDLLPVNAREEYMLFHFISTGIS